MKLSKIVSVLFAGAIAFAPMAAQSKPLGAGYGGVVKATQLLWQECTSFAEQGFVGDGEIVGNCAVIGVYVEGQNLSPETKLTVLELVQTAQKLQARCIRLYEGAGTSHIGTIKMCANLGVGVDNTNLD